MEKLTKEQAIQNHRKMWNWIAENIEKCRNDGVSSLPSIKEVYFKHTDAIPVFNHCYMCGYDNQCVATGEKHCKNCLIVNPYVLNAGRCLSGLYDWACDYYAAEDSFDLKTMKNVAKNIANLPTRDLVKNAVNEYNALKERVTSYKDSFKDLYKDLNGFNYEEYSDFKHFDCNGQYITATVNLENDKFFLSDNFDIWDNDGFTVCENINIENAKTCIE